MGFIRDLFSSPSPPASPDFVGVAGRQAELNKEAARFDASLNRPDTVTPFSTSTFRQTAPDQFLSTTTLAPEYEAIRSGQAGVQRGLTDLATNRLGQIPTDPFSLSGASYQLPEFADFQTFSQGAADEFFNRASARLVPEFEREKTALQDGLIASGIPVGSDAFNTEMERFEQRKDDAFNQLATESIFQGQNLLSQTMGNILTGRQQQLSDILLQRTQPVSELSALLGGGAVLPQPSSAPPTLGAVAGAAPADIFGATQTAQQDALARFQGNVQRQQALLDPFVTLGAARLARPT